VRVVDLNCDLGEGVGDDLLLFPLITSANIACGGHAGDADTMRIACERAREHGVTIGAHPSYADREGFGRRPVDVAPDVLTAQLRDQIGALRAVAAEVGMAISYVKPHGALYNRIAVDEQQAEAVAGVAATEGLPLLGQAGTAVERAAGRLGVPFISEVFADRGYHADGTLAARGTPDALLTDRVEVAERALRMVTESSVPAVDGTPVALRPQSICLHGDTAGAAGIAAAVRRRLLEAGVELRAFG
jgi:UPF0271 protein